MYRPFDSYRVAAHNCCVLKAKLNAVSIKAMNRRLISILLFLLLPLQMTWAAVVPYCQHEGGIEAQHFGHHEHQHDHGNHDQLSQNNHALTNVDPVSSEDNSLFGSNVTTATIVDGLDSDCGTCHASCATAILGNEVLPDVLLSPTRTTSSEARASLSDKDRPERPNWSSLA
jgi:hypothetical protein